MLVQLAGGIAQNLKRRNNPPVTTPIVPMRAPATAVAGARFARQTILPGIGDDGQRRICSARVTVVGAGGLGAPVVQYLAAAGVGQSRIIDHDVVEPSNLQRQVLFTATDVGAAKAELTAAAAKRLNPDLVVDPVVRQITPANATELLNDCDLVVDGTDNFATRFTIADGCASLGKPYVWGAIHQFYGQVAVFWRNAPATAQVPADRQVNVRDLHPGGGDQVPSCAEIGVLSPVCGVVGSFMATEVLKLTTGVGTPLLGEVLLLDTLAGTSRTIRVRPRTEPAAAVSRTEPRTMPVQDFDPHDPAIFVLDVREPHECAALPMPGAVNVPLAQVATWDLTAAGDRPIVVVCAVGARSRTAAIALQARGYQNVTVLTGGMTAWSIR